MAENSKREKILQNVVETLGGIPAVRLVERRHPAFREFTDKIIPVTQLPYIGVVGGLPQPEQYLNTQSRIRIPAELISTMSIDLLCVFLAPDAAVKAEFGLLLGDSPDEWISYYLDEIFRVLFVDVGRGVDEYGKALAISTALRPDLNTGVLPPYVAFFLTLDVVYRHNVTGI